MRWYTKRCCGISLLVIFDIFAIVSLVLALKWNEIYNKVLNKELVLSNTSQSYNLWKETPIPMYMSVYLFNWTNYDEVVNSNWKIKPHFQECGPYVYLEHHIHVNLVWNDNNTVTYQQKKLWHFQPKMSNGTLNDTITNVNPVVVTLGAKIKDLPGAVLYIINPILKLLEKNLVVTKTVDELLFKGFEDKFLDIMHKLPNNNSPDRFGWFYGRNGSSTVDGVYNMYTGKGDLDRLGIIKLWNGESKSNFFSGNCNIIHGTSGELWPPVSKSERVYIFSSDICSSIAFDYIPSNLTVNGVSGNKFIGTDFNFDNGTKYSSQGCFKGSRVIPSGLRDVSKCRDGAPAFLSYPHFYLADPIYRTSVDGIHPTKTLHEMYILLEPKTGIPLKVQAQLQLNLLIEPIPHLKIFEDVKTTYIPMMWFKQSATLTEKYTNMAGLLISLSDFGTTFGWSVFAFSICLIVLGIYLTFIPKKKEIESEQLLVDDQDS